MTALMLPCYAAAAKFQAKYISSFSTLAKSGANVVNVDPAISQCSNSITTFKATKPTRLVSVSSGISVTSWYETQ